MIDKKQITELAQERIDELDRDLFIVDLSVSPTNVIQVEIDSKVGNVSIDDCIRVSRNIEHNLDREEEDFELHVSSAGLDKPFRVVEQYIKNVGQNVKVKLNDGTKLEGELKTADNSSFVVETSRKERIEGRKKKETIIENHTIGYDQVKETKIIISFK
jgi:ribosome maturation factor RimP